VMGQEQRRSHHHRDKEGVVRALLEVAVQPPQRWSKQVGNDTRDRTSRRLGDSSARVGDWVFESVKKKSDNSRRIHFEILSAGNLQRK